MKLLLIPKWWVHNHNFGINFLYQNNIFNLLKGVQKVGILPYCNDVFKPPYRWYFKH